LVDQFLDLEELAIPGTELVEVLDHKGLANMQPISQPFREGLIVANAVFLVQQLEN